MSDKSGHLQLSYAYHKLNHCKEINILENENFPEQFCSFLKEVIHQKTDSLQGDRIWQNVTQNNVTRTEHSFKSCKSGHK